MPKKKKNKIKIYGRDKNNKSGVVGTYVVKHNSGNKSYCANIWLKINGYMKHVHLGSFKNLNEAKKARKEAEKKYWGVK